MKPAWKLLMDASNLLDEAKDEWVNRSPNQHIVLLILSAEGRRKPQDR